MRKSDKKLDGAIIAALTRICDEAQTATPGFQWITHFVDYGAFPDSLRVVGVFDTDQQLAALKADQSDDYLSAKIYAELKNAGISLPDERRQIVFDSEEACEREHAGNWQQRYRNRNRQLH